MRYEHGAIHTICPKCKADVSVDVEWLLLRLEYEIEQLSELRETLLRQRDEAISVEKRRKPGGRPKLIA
jgi:hypothetical protein